MRVTHIHAYNFRSLDDLHLDLSSDGMTALVGHPGSGKSSIISLVPFVFYGDTGSNGSLVDLRRRGSDPKARCGGTITFTHGQDTVVASRWLTRTTPRGKVKETAHATLTINGDEVDGITPTRLTEEMTRLLGMPRDAFRGAAFIGQGEVDTLATATPAEVQKLVEHHTGLAQLTKERDRQRQVMRDAVNAANALPGSLDELERLTDARDDAAAHSDKARQGADTAADKARHTKGLLAEAQKRHRDLYDAERAAARSRDAVVAARAVAESRHQAVQQARDELDRLGLDPDTDLDALRADQGRLNALNADLVQAGTAYSHQLAEVDRQTKHLADVEARLADIDLDALHDARDIGEKAARDADTEARAAGEDRAAHAAEVARLDRAIDQLRSADAGAACCPTCRQELADLAGLIDEFTAQRTTAQDAANKAAKKMQAARSDADLAAGTLRGLDGKLRAAESAARDVNRAHASLDDATKRAAGERLALARTIAAVDDTEPSDADGDTLLAAGREAVRTIAARIDDIGTRGRAISAVHTAEAAADKADQAIADAQEAVQDAPDPDQIADAAADVARLQENYDTDSTEAADAARIASAAEVALAHADAAAGAEQKRWDAKQAALADAEVATGVATCVDALRSELLADFTGHISAAASELLAQFGGEHTAFHLDADFIPRVELADGTRVETKTLSGGEKARAGLAFRLGITLQITRGGIPDQVIGDEVTNYLDEEGRRAVIAALQQQFPSVLLISHTPEALDLAATVVALDRAPMGATTVLEDTDTEHTPLAEAS